MNPRSEIQKGDLVEIITCRYAGIVAGMKYPTTKSNTMKPKRTSSNQGPALYSGWFYRISPKKGLCSYKRKGVFIYCGRLLNENRTHDG